MLSFPKNIQMLCHKNFAEVEPATPIAIQIGDDLFAQSARGVTHNNNQDAVALAIHPQNSDFRCAVVADGVSDAKYGAEAAESTVRDFSIFFSNLPKNLYNAPTSELTKKITEFIFELNDALCNFGEGYNTTLCAAITAENATHFFVCGDSCGFIQYINRPLKLSTLPQTLHFNSAGYPIAEQSNSVPPNVNYHHAQFSRNNSLIMSGLGWLKTDTMHIWHTAINNSNIKSVILTTDGVHDFLAPKTFSDYSETGNIRSLMQDMCHMKGTAYINPEEEVLAGFAAEKIICDDDMTLAHINFPKTR